MFKTKKRIETLEKEVAELKSTIEVMNFTGNFDYNKVTVKVYRPSLPFLNTQLHFIYVYAGSLKTTIHCVDPDTIIDYNSKPEIVHNDDEICVVTIGDLKFRLIKSSSDVSQITE